ncbi:MAG: hypothetical protein ABIH46_10900 [Chloroflexota bacterium]
MAARQQLISRRRKELMAKGYPNGIVDLAMSWALNSAEGMANYVLQQDIADSENSDVEKMTTRFLPRYLKDSENWIKSFGHQPKIG